ncbi:uncharacterized protein CcaverHIS019_0206330 [Cutaneotrichosporon cavernicola]|uniref:Ubiquitin-like domain-containing protein n=1 Tax=Cutaneotrichosporon cavernicola TaxID=279322 RepID=A0AA48L013_9TREE|nr:uncharacterized protein CcaverHIS019_0206330 [Cutaneotrichosporon cavernicola]BEI89271.1 hypothetical protein CcaverHIS019_0206330 [Cutaneotrichosporon cavernicola]
MSTPPEPSENEPLLPPPASMGPASRSKLHARRYLPPPSDKAKGKQRAISPSDDEAQAPPDLPKAKGKTRAPDPGRPVTVIFSNEEDAGGHLEVWVEEGESVGKVKDKIRHMRPNVAGNQLRLIHAGRLLTDGILLLPWLRSLEERVRRQAGGAGVGDVLREVGRGLAGDDEEEEPEPVQERVYLHCNVGGPLEGAPTPSETEPEAVVPRRRGFDALLDAGLSPEEVAAMRRQFYESRGEEVPDLDVGVNDEHARALEEQWIEGDLTPETATTSSEGMYTAILHGLLAGFLYPLTPWFFFREEPLPNFFDAEAEADQLARRAESAARAEDERRAAAHAAAMRGHAGSDSLEVPHASSPAPSRESGSMRVSSSPLVGGELVGSVVFSKRMRIGIYLGTMINVVFGALRFLSV